MHDVTRYYDCENVCNGDKRWQKTTNIRNLQTTNPNIAKLMQAAMQEP